MNVPALAATLQVTLEVVAESAGLSKINSTCDVEPFPFQVTVMPLPRDTVRPFALAGLVKVGEMGTFRFAVNGPMSFPCQPLRWSSRQGPGNFLPWR